MVGLNNAGYDVAAILAGLGVGGLAFALAAQDKVANIFGGITIFLQRPFRVGDLIEFEGRTMTIKEIGLRSSRLQDFDYGYMITIPNSKFTSGIVTNITAHPGHWVYMKLKLSPVTNATQMELALRLIREAIEGHEEIDRCEAAFRDFDDYALGVLVFYHMVDWNHRFRVQTEVNLELMRHFAAHDIKMALPVEVRKEYSSSVGGVFG